MVCTRSGCPGDGRKCMNEAGSWGIAEAVSKLAVLERGTCGEIRGSETFDRVFRGQTSSPSGPSLRALTGIEA